MIRIHLKRHFYQWKEGWYFSGPIVDNKWKKPAGNFCTRVKNINTCGCGGEDKIYVIIFEFKLGLWTGLDLTWTSDCSCQYCHNYRSLFVAQEFGCVAMLHYHQVWCDNRRKFFKTSSFSVNQPWHHYGTLPYAWLHCHWLTLE